MQGQGSRFPAYKVNNGESRRVLYVCSSGNLPASLGIQHTYPHVILDSNSSLDACNFPEIGKARERVECK